MRRKRPSRTRGCLLIATRLPEDSQDGFNDRTGLIVGSGGGNYTSNYDYLPLITEAKGELHGFGAELSNMVTPMWLLKNLPNNVLCHVGIRGQLKGNQCLHHQSVRQRYHGRGRVCVCDREWGSGSNRGSRSRCAPFEPEMVLYYHKLGLMSSETPRPFDRNRSGTVFGEGAASVVLEKESDASERGANVLGEFLGFGCCSEATGILDLDPEGDGVFRAIEQCLEDAGLQTSDIGMICAHGNGTDASDLSESIGIRRAFGEDIPPVTGFKWAYGHLIGASGIADIVMTLEALKQNVVPAIPTCEEIDSSCG